MRRVVPSRRIVLYDILISSQTENHFRLLQIALLILPLAISVFSIVKKDGGANQNPGDEFRAELENALQDFQITTLSAEQKERLLRHYQMLLDWNRHTNLTRIIKPKEAARLHYAESIFSARFITDAHTILDIGSGAGFPAVPLASVRDDIEITALEANQKKALFLNEVKDALQLKNFHVARQRIEDFNLSTFDILISRALDSADEMMRRILQRMSTEQRLLLYSSHAMLETLYAEVADRFTIEYHKIPHSELRYLAAFSSK